MVPEVALFIPDLNGGGAERVAVNLANAFHAGGRATEVVLARARGPLRADLSDEVAVVDLKVRRRHEVIRSLARYLEMRKPDALLANMDIANVAAIIARHFSAPRTRLITCTHVAPSVQAMKSGNLKDLSLLLAVRWLYPRADGVVAVSEGVAADLSGRLGVPRERISVIYNPVVTEELLALSRERVEHRWFGSGEPPVVLAVGRLTRQKDYPTLLRAFRRLRAGTRARLMILGEGEERERLQRLVGELGVEGDVEFVGFVRNPYAFMSRAAVLVLSSGWEGFGNVLVEAMACGTPVVSTDCPSGPREILDGGRYGPLVPVGDDKALADALSRRLRLPAERDSLRARARDFSVDVAANQYVALIEQARSGNRQTLRVAR